MKSPVGPLRCFWWPPALPVAKAPPELHSTWQLRHELRKGRDTARDVQPGVHVFAQQIEALRIVRRREEASTQRSRADGICLVQHGSRRSSKRVWAIAKVKPIISASNPRIDAFSIATLSPP